MKTVRFALSFAALAMVCSFTTSAHADSSIDSASTSKRVDLRLKAIQEEKAAAAAWYKAAAAKPEVATKTVDSSRMTDFMSLSSKRVDLRLRTLKVGVNQAYAEWMASDHPLEVAPSSVHVATSTK